MRQMGKKEPNNRKQQKFTGLCICLDCSVSLDRIKACTGCEMAQLRGCKPQFLNCATHLKQSRKSYHHITWECTSQFLSTAHLSSPLETLYLCSPEIYDRGLVTSQITQMLEIRTQRSCFFLISCLSRWTLVYFSNIRRTLFQVC